MPRKDKPNPYSMYSEDETARPTGMGRSQDAEYNPYADDPADTDAMPTHRHHLPHAHARQEGNPLGTLGFVVSLLGPLAPLGVVMCLFALRHEPKRMAIAGIIVGILISLMTYICGGLAGLGVWAVMSTTDEYTEIARDYNAISTAVAEYRRENSGGLPPDLSALALPSDVTTDPFGDEYTYSQSQGAWYLGFKGVDGARGTGDDCEIPGGITINPDPLQQTPYEPLQQALGQGAMLDIFR